ncbi:hypothetical protein NQ315_010337 [Exocentrus adspersus]|uniref:Uncharacterized protein n=1 Tax=Exocentrus adspersus TaxID=1586481 RepID=A0AAV8WDH6_9CUCU|nr:hypothetical protein NQ315_010337 [Exocentrus adspersus]
MAEEELVDIDCMLQHVGNFGRFQLILMLLFSTINAFSAFHYFGQTFISVVPDYHCDVRNYDLNVTVPYKCHVSVSQDEVECSTGWVFLKNNTYGFVGIIEELEWVCDNAWKPALGQSVFFIGSVIGSLTLGVLADFIGRLHVLVIANMLAFFGNMATILSSDITIFALSRFAAGCATDTNFVMMYIIVMEYIKPSLRTLGSEPMHRLVLLPLLYGSALVPHLSVLGFYFLVPESAQWLISKGRTEDAIQCFRRIAKINKRTVNDKIVESLRKYCEVHVSSKQTNESFLGLLKTPKLRRKTIILVFKSMVLTLCYDAISRNVNGLGYSPFVVFTATSSTILPACLFILAVQDKAGRKALASGSLLLSGVFTTGSGVIQAFMQNPEPILIITLAVIARLGINVAYNSGAQYAVELIPTVVRGQGVSAIHVAGYAASFFSPQILYLSNIWKPSPEVILGVLLVLGAIACLFLPETLNRTLPVTLKDGEEFGEDEGIFEFACCRAPTESMAALNPRQDS